MTRNYLAALGLAFLIGAVLGPIFGYTFESAPPSFGLWIKYPLGYTSLATGWWPWSLFGGLIGAACVYAAHLIKRA